MKKYLFIFIAGIILVAAGHSLVVYLKGRNTQKAADNQISLTIPENSSVETLKKTTEKNEQVQEYQDENTAKKIEQKVPFIVQAPLGNWKDPIFQNGCEEAAMIMAAGWLKKTSEILPQDAQNKIKKIAIFEDKVLGYNADTDIHDMQKIFQEYFHFQNIKVQENIEMENIKDEIRKGNIVLVPTFGRALKNPNFTSPGPITHMLVIIGYDPKAKKFITNDPGTKRGKNYVYDESVLFDAIWQYSSGKNHSKPPKGLLKKGMLVVQSE